MRFRLDQNQAYLVYAAFKYNGYLADAEEFLEKIKEKPSGRLCDAMADQVYRHYDDDLTYYENIEKAYHLVKDSVEYVEGDSSITPYYKQYHINDTAIPVDDDVESDDGKEHTYSVVVREVFTETTDVEASSVEEAREKPWRCTAVNYPTL